MKGIQLPFTNMSGTEFPEGICAAAKLTIQFAKKPSEIRGDMHTKLYDDADHYLDEEKTGVVACPRVNFDKTNISNATKQKFADAIESLFQDMADGTTPVDTGRNGTHHDFTQGIVITLPTA